MLSSRQSLAISRRLLARPPRRLLSSKPPQTKYVDAQEEANQRITDNLGNLSGIDAVNALPMEIHLRNYATAAGLVGFVAAVFYYSLDAVRGSTGSDPLANLQSEAAEARVKKAKEADRNSEDLAQLDMGVSEKDMEEQGITIAVAAPDDIATREEARNRAVLSKSEGQQRSLLNKIVFFWR